MRRLSFTATSLFLLFTARAAALIVFGENIGTSTYQQPPPNGAPWAYAIQQKAGGAVDASGVYLGNGYILTANHTNFPDAILLDNQAYSPDPSFEALGFGATDLRLYRIQSPPTFPLLAIVDLSDADTNKPTTLIGWGKGKGEEINGGFFGPRGWYWGGEETKLKRWGTNTTFAAVDNSPGYPALVVSFNNTPNSEAVAALGDSGSPFFQQFGTTWKLAGVTAAVSTGSHQNASLYSIPPSQTFAVRILDLADQLRYSQWKQARSIAGPTPNDTDSDADGISLVQEYAFGTEPDEPSSEARPVAGNVGTDVTLTYQLHRARTDLTVAIEQSIDLETWSPAEVIATETVSNNESIRTYRAHVPMNDDPQKFLRIKITALN